MAEDFELIYARLREAIEENFRQFQRQIYSTGKGEVDGTVIDFTEPAPDNFIDNPYYANLDWPAPREIPPAAGDTTGFTRVAGYRGHTSTHYIIDETHVFPMTVETVAAKYATAPNDGPPRRDWQWERAGIVHQEEHWGVDYRG